MAHGICFHRALARHYHRKINQRRAPRARRFYPSKKTVSDCRCRVRGKQFRGATPRAQTRFAIQFAAARGKK
ncbi:MAG: hypothetical protein B6D41_07700 [Chloroflexi bacterium UTCFX4]|nr:MAG: hypothetical protein B6D41_07700 [Chloroflexi bacterium UTCFX4]